MSSSPRVSIVIAAYNDEAWVGASLDSCLAQTERNIEIVVVDDASTDSTYEIVKRYSQLDSRVRLIRQRENRSAFQARREGVLAATASRLMFLDGDDALVPTAVAEALSTADASGADVVGFGVEVVVPAGMSVGRFAGDLQPKHAELSGDEITPALFPVGKIAQGHLWRYLWGVHLLRDAYMSLPADLRLYRANDIPIAFLALTSAKKYVSVASKLYRYFWHRGVSGRTVADAETFDLYLSAVDSIDSIADSIDAAAQSKTSSTGLRESYRSARLSIIQMILRYVTSIESTSLQDECFERLESKAGSAEVVLAAASFHHAALPLLSRHAVEVPVRRTLRNVVIVTGNLAAGGLQGVVISQARHLAESGHTVTIVARTFDGRTHEPLENVDAVVLHGHTVGERIASFLEILRERDIDIVLNHWLLYDENWPFFPLAARTVGVPTIGWIHNFALRTVYDFSTRGSLLATYLPLLLRTVVLSKIDVVFWKLRGVHNAVYLPNPPSPLLLDLPHDGTPRSAPDGPIRLVWWGRLQQHTKRVRDLVDVAAALRVRDVEFRLAIIGPDSDDTTADDLHEYAFERGVADAIDIPGIRHGSELMEWLEVSDLCIYTSAIEGYPLSLVEAQAVGLPVIMYELPWLAVVQENDGIVQVPQGDPHALAEQIALLSADSSAYVARSQAALRAGREALAHDFTQLYSQLLADELPPELSPEPTLEDARLLLNLSLRLEESVVVRERSHAQRLADQRNRACREAERLRLENAKLNEPTIVAGIRPLGRAALKMLPSLRPMARRFNRWVRGL
ncbi:glycosyltransferase [Microbacterium suaedae]|uniref:glycosyltransferase n=1 Tax=Microbacterium suaedae TaxID=2067813 RepID=UPI0013A63403|nr:glycosyltransferase [Microbacterium suaedae]